MVRPATTGLATAFFRLYLLDALAPGPARPATLLASVAAERLPLANGAFGRALQSLLEGGHLAPAPQGMVGLTAVGAAERMAERGRWAAVVPTVLRLLGEMDPRPTPVVAEAPPVPLAPVRIADEYLDRVLVASLRERVAAARETGRPFALVLGLIDLQHASEAHRRAMLHRAIRATLSGTSTLFGGDVSAYRYGDAGVAVVASLDGDTGRGERLATLVRTRLDELLRTMTSSVRAFGGSRWSVRAGTATWAPTIVASVTLLRQAEDALASDGRRVDAA